MEKSAAALLLEPGLLSREQSVLHCLLTDVPEGYVEHAEEALRHANLAISTMSILDHGIWDDAEPLITLLEMSLEKARNFKTVIDRVVKERVLVPLLPPIRTRF